MDNLRPGKPTRVRLRGASICLVSIGALGLSACSGKPPFDPNDDPPQKTLVAEFVLVTVLGAGVTGTPFTGWSSHDSASTVAYEFSVRTEFSNLRVWLDDELTAPSGFVLMDGDHTLIALADTVFAFSAGDSVVLNSIRSLVSSTDPLASILASVPPHHRTARSLHVVSPHGPPCAPTAPAAVYPPLRKR